MSLITLMCQTCIPNKQIFLFLPNKGYIFVFICRPSVRNLRIANTPHFYDSIEADDSIKPKPTDTQKIQQSRRLPGWIWRIITYVLGVHTARKWLSFFIYGLTIISALSFTALGVVYVVYDISSKNSKTTAHIGFISLLIGFGWLSLGIYSYKLAGRLFSDENFAASVRTHSRTLFKINTAILLALTGFGFLGKLSLKTEIFS